MTKNLGEPPSGRRLPVWIAVSFVVLSLSVAAQSLNAVHRIPIFDEVAYLDLARLFHEMGPPHKIVSAYVQAHVDENMRNPLYPMLVSLFVSNTPEDFPAGKILSLFLSVLLLGTVVVVTQRLFGLLPALAALALLGYSEAFIDLSHSIQADTVFTLFFFLAGSILLKKELKRADWLSFGAMSGLAYLAKANGYFLLLGGLALILRQKRLKTFSGPAVFLMLGSFAAVSSFLLIRDYRMWGTLFGNKASKIFWIDRWDDYFTLFGTPAWDKLGFRWYFSHHSIGDALARICEGAVSALRELLTCVSPKSTPMWASVFIGPAFLFFLFLGLRKAFKSGKKESAIAYVFTPLLLFLLLCWYMPGVGSHVRFVFPIFVCLVPLASAGLADAWERLKSGQRMIRVPSLGLLLPLLILSASSLLAWRNREGFRENPMKNYYLPAYWRMTSDWLRAHAQPHGYILHNYSPFSTWDKRPHLGHPYPLLSSSQNSIRDFMKTNDIAYVLVDRFYIAGDQDPGRYGVSDSRGPMTYLGLKRCFHDSKEPSVFLIYGSGCPDL